MLKEIILLRKIFAYMYTKSMILKHNFRSSEGEIAMEGLTCRYMDFCLNFLTKIVKMFTRQMLFKVFQR